MPVLQRHRAREIHFLVSDIFAKGRPHWPTSRAALRGLRLRQVGDAIRIFVAQVYCDHLRGAAPDGMYASLKKNWDGLYGMLPVAFIRTDDWDAASRIADVRERGLALMASGVKFHDAESRNDEEREYFDDETFSSFVAYLESLPRDYPHIMPHVFGHLSTRYIYVDDMIPVIEGGPTSESRQPG
jgi:hypothetical protein